MNIKRLLMLALLTLPMALMAQMKIATVDVQAIFAAMPESQRANEQLEKASQQYKAEYEMMQQEFNDKYAAYQGLAGDTPATIRDRRVREIQESNNSIESFLAKSQAALAAIKQELETPIYAKINAAIKVVGDAGHYTYIIDVSRVPVVYTGAGAIDITAEVKRSLGIE